MRMSKEQENNLAWVFRIITTALLGAASFLGASVYNKVDDMYWLVKVHEEQIIELRKQNDKKDKEIENLKMQDAILRENYFEIKQRLTTADR